MSPVVIINESGFIDTVGGVLSDRFTNSGTEFLYVVQGIDLCATQSEPTHLTFDAQLVGTQFYYDSQSTGEGLGVYSAWRGSVALATDDWLQCDVTWLSGTGDPFCSIVAWGVVLPASPGPYP